MSLPIGQSSIALFALLLFFSGCGRDTTLHPLTGKVTLGGKPYKRLLVYFRPMEGKVDEFNLGVGETDANGNLSLRSTAGGGLIKGAYRVSFSCMVTPRASEAVNPDVKLDRPQDPQPVEKVPASYADGNVSPVTFEIKAGNNHFEFDIPETDKSLSQKGSDLLEARSKLSFFHTHAAPERVRPLLG